MEQEGFRPLIRFLRDGGNVLPVVIREGPSFTLGKSYDRIDSRGEGVGRPLLTLTIEPRRASQAHALLGTSVLPGPEGAVYVIEAETASALPDGRRIDQYRGIRTGLYRIQAEQGHVARSADGSFATAPTEAGLRRKLANSDRLGGGANLPPTR